MQQRFVYSLAVGKGTSNLRNSFHYRFNELRLQNMSTSASGGSGAETKSIVAVGQMRATNDLAANMRQVEQLMTRAKSQAATCLFLPECCDFVGRHRAETLQLSQPLNGTTMQQYRELAKKHGIWLSLGGLHERVVPNGEPGEEMNKIYKAHVLVNDLGDIVSVYRKLHLFNVDTPDFRFRESDIVKPGEHIIPPVLTPVGNLGLQICYDLRFAESSLLLRKAGAQLLTYPSAFTYSTGQAHWEILLRARAIENQCFVVAAAQVGAHNEKRKSWGHAMIVDPWGKVLADCGEEELAIATAEIDLNKIKIVERNMPCFEHRRGDVYAISTLDAGTCEAAKDNLFDSNVIRKETIFYETPHCYAFTNLRCVVEGHVLVSTKCLKRRLKDLTCAELCDLFAAVCKIQRMLETYYGTTSATVTVQDGPYAGQTVPHVHFHIMPRRPGDFQENDQIYIKMDDRCLDQPDRTIKERIEEAEKYRKFMSDDKVYLNGKFVNHSSTC